MRKILIAALLCAIAAGVAASATAPVWVCNAPTKYFLETTEDSTMAGVPKDLSGLGLIQIHAVTDTKVSFWTYNGSAWSKVRPVFGVQLPDTCVFIPAGTTQSFTFPKPFVQGVYRTSGTAYFSGE